MTWSLRSGTVVSGHLRAAAASDETSWREISIAAKPVLGSQECCRIVKAVRRYVAERSDSAQAAACITRSRSAGIEIDPRADSTASRASLATGAAKAGPTRPATVPRVVTRWTIAVASPAP